MGQYFNAVIVSNGYADIYDPQRSRFKQVLGLKKGESSLEYSVYGSEKADLFWECFSGCKLMEHSWDGNPFVNGVCKEIKDNPSLVIWLGDYADSLTSCDFTRYEHVNPKEFENIVKFYHKSIFKSDSEDIKTVENAYDKNISSFTHDDSLLGDGFIINHTLMEFVDLALFRKKWSTESNEAWLCVHPLPILTAVGPGISNEPESPFSDEQIGIWAYCEISYSEKRPGKEFKEFQPVGFDVF